MKNSKMLSTTASFAHTYGISRGQKEKALGLNPNLNIEDEYIENLLKQINFLSIQIKLLKQKQGESKKLGIIGLIDRDQQPVVSHAIESNQKFQSMKGNLQSKVSDLQASTLLLEDENTALFAQKQFLEKELGNEQIKLGALNTDTGKQLLDLTERVQNFKTRLFEIKEQNGKTQKAYDYAIEEYERTINNDKKSKLLKSIDSNLKGEETECNQKFFNDKSETTKNNFAYWESISKQFQTDPQYLQFIEQNAKIKDKLRVMDKEIFNLGYKAKQFQELKSLAERNILVEKQLQKQASFELQKLNQILKDKKEDFDKRIAERKRMTDLEPETRKLEALSITGQKQVDEIKKKADLVECVYKKYREQILLLETQYEAAKLITQDLTGKLDELAPETNQYQSQFNQASAQLQVQLKQLDNVKGGYYSSKKQLFKLEQELSYLNAKQQFLEKTLNVNEELNSLRLQELRGISQNNFSVNEAIDQLLGKMDQMRRFAKNPMVLRS